MIKNTTRRFIDGISASFCFYHFPVYCNFETLEQKEKYLSSTDWYFSKQLNI